MTGTAHTGDTRQASCVEQAVQAIATDQERIRQNLGPLKGTAEERRLVQRYVSRLSDHENRLITLNHQSDRAIADRARAGAACAAAVKGFAVCVVEPGTTCR